MKRKIILIPVLIIISVFTFESCGSIVFSSRLGTPPPPWFYPNRIETVRYVYFPEYELYYDLAFRNYRYTNNGIWFSTIVIPNHLNGVNLKRSKKVKINNYFNDDLQKYHRENTVKRRKPSNTSR